MSKTVVNLKVQSFGCADFECLSTTSSKDLMFRRRAAVSVILSEFDIERRRH